MKFTSKAEEIRYYTKELLSDNKEHSVQDIKEYTLKSTGKEFTDGAYAGAIRDLVAKEDGYENPRRGIYIYRANSTGLSQITNEILKETLDKLYSEIGKVNILNVTDEDLVVVAEIKKAIKSLEEIKDKFK